MDETPASAQGETPEDQSAANHAQLARSFQTIISDRPQAVTTLVQTFIAFVGPDLRQRRQLSDDVLKTAFVLDSQKEDHAHTRKLVELVIVGIIALSLIVGVLILVSLVRDHVDLVKTIFDGVGLLVSHGVVGTGG